MGPEEFARHQLEVLTAEYGINAQTRRYLLRSLTERLGRVPVSPLKAAYERHKSLAQGRRSYRPRA